MEKVVYKIVNAEGEFSLGGQTQVSYFKEITYEFDVFQAQILDANDNAFTGDYALAA